MFAFERHWALCTLEGFAPDGPKGLAPRGERIEWMAAWDLMNGAGTSKGRLGTRLALWFIAFAPADAPEIVVVVMIEEGETGGRTAAPLAAEFLEAYFTREKPEETEPDVPSAATEE